MSVSSQARQPPLQPWLEISSPHRTPEIVEGGLKPQCPSRGGGGAGGAQRSLPGSGGNLSLACSVPDLELHEHENEPVAGGLG